LGIFHARGRRAPSTFSGGQMPDQIADFPRDRALERIKKLLVAIPSTRPIGIDDQLSDAGLNSIDMVNLMLAIEAEFDFTIPTPDITPENFKSISTIEILIRRVHPESGDVELLTPPPG
jgi:acyl carrier protein